MQINNSDVNNWIELFQHAIALSDSKNVHLLLKNLPLFNTVEEMQKVLLLSMDAESMLCTLRQNLVNKRADITSQLSSL